MYYFIVNPRSKTGKGLSVWGQVHTQLQRQHVPFRYFFTRYRGHAKILARQLSELLTTKDVMVALGGDGTIHEIVNGLEHPERILLGYIPTGSGNDFARGLGIPTNTKKALELLLNSSSIRKVDLPYVQIGSKKQYFAVSCGFGFDAAICHECLSSPLKKYLNKLHLGKLTYAFVAMKQLLSFHPLDLTLHLDHNRRIYLKNAYFAAIMNQPYEGGGFHFCPSARNNDRILDIITIANIPKWKVPFLLPTAFFGQHTRFQGVHTYKCRQIRITNQRKTPIHTDGEFSGIYHQVSVSLAPVQLRIKAP